MTYANRIRQTTARAARRRSLHPNRDVELRRWLEDERRNREHEAIWRANRDRALVDGQ